MVLHSDQWKLRQLYVPDVLSDVTVFICLCIINITVHVVISNCGSLQKKVQCQPIGLGLIYNVWSWNPGTDLSCFHMGYSCMLG